MNRHLLTRRDALLLLGLSAAGGVLAACSTAAPAQPTPAPAPAQTNPPAAAATVAPAVKPTTPPAAAATTQPAPAATTAPAAAGPAGSLTIAQGVDAESLDPYVTTSGASKGMLWTVYDRLVIRDLDLALKPGLATSWKALDDATWE